MVGARRREAFGCSLLLASAGALARLLHGDRGRAFSGSVACVRRRHWQRPAAGTGRDYAERAGRWAEAQVAAVAPAVTVDRLAKLAPVSRLKEIGELCEGEFTDLGNTLKTHSVLDPSMKERIEGTGRKAGIPGGCIPEVWGSQSLRTAVTLSNDVDVGIRTPGRKIDRADRVRFKEQLEEEGVDVAHMGQKSIMIFTGGGAPIDLVFLDLAHDVASEDKSLHAQHDAFYSGDQEAQNAVRMIKLAFHGVRRLPGVLVEQLVRRTARSGHGSRAKALYEHALRAIQGNMPALRASMHEVRSTRGDSLTESIFAQQALLAQCDRMRNVILDAER